MWKFLLFILLCPVPIFADLKIYTPFAPSCPDIVQVLGTSSFRPVIFPMVRELAGKARSDAALKVVYDWYLSALQVTDSQLAQARAIDAQIDPNHQIDIEFRDAQGVLRGFMRLVSTTPVFFQRDVEVSTRQRLPHFLTYAGDPAIAAKEGNYPRAVEAIRTYTDPALGISRFRVLMLMFRAAISVLWEMKKLDHEFVSSSMEHNFSLYDTIGFLTDDTLSLSEKGRWFQRRSINELAGRYLIDVENALAPHAVPWWLPASSAWARPALIAPLAARIHSEVAMWGTANPAVDTLVPIAASPQDRALILFREMHHQIHQHFDLLTGIGNPEAAIQAIDTPQNQETFSAAALDPDAGHDLRLYAMGVVRAVAGQGGEAARLRDEIERRDNLPPHHCAPMRAIASALIERLERQYGPISGRSVDSLQSELQQIEDLRVVFPYWLTREVHLRRAGLYTALGVGEEAAAAQRLAQELGK